MPEPPTEPTSAREALRRLSRKYPASTDLEKILNDLISAPDMPVAIISAALAEATLEKLIQSRLKSSDPNLIGRIFNNRGPLSDFDSKILIAQAFGIITGPLATELHSLQVIRNTFAHAKIPVSFDHELIDREIKTLKTRERMLAVSSGSDLPFNLDNKGWYGLIARIAIIIMDGIEKHGGTADDAIADMLKP